MTEVTQMIIATTKAKKGYALIYVMCIILILTSFTLAILSLAALNRVTTSGLNKSNKAHLAAEAGMEEAVKYFKNYVSSHYDEYFTRKNTVTPDDYHIQPSATRYSQDSTDNIYTHTSNCSDGSSYSYTLKFEGGSLDSDPSHNIETTDTSTGNSIRCLVITSTGTFNHVTKTITASVAENEISNIYQDKMFTKPITTYTNNNSISVPKINTKNMGTDSKKFIMPSNSIPLLIYKRNSSDGSTLKQLTDDVYNYINNPSNIDIQTQLNAITPNIENELNNTNTSTDENRKKIISYIHSISTGTDDVNNKINDMLKYSRINKVLLVDGDLNVGEMGEPLINYVIYCTGDFIFSSNANLKLWNCNVYAKNIEYYDGTSNYPISFNYQKNDVDVVSITYSKGTEIKQTSGIEVKGITSTDAKTTILQYLMASYPYTDGNDVPYSDYYANQTNKGATPSDAASVFPTESTDQFSDSERTTVNEQLNENIDGYAYGLKLRYVYWEEN